MRILHVVPTYLPATRYGGPIYSVHGLCKALAGRGHDVHVYTTSVDGAGNSAVAHEEAVDLDGVSVWYFRSRILRRLYWAPRMSRMLRENLAQFDIVHVHSVYLWPTCAAARACWKAEVPYLLAPRGMLVPELIGRRGWLRKSLWIRMLERAHIERAAAVHATSEMEITELRRFGFRLPRVVSVPNGVDVGRAEQGREQHDENAILFLGRINWKKGLDRLLEALAIVPGTQLWIAGNDEENYLPSLKAVVNRLDLAPRVRFLGPVFGAQKSDLYRRAGAFVLPSHSENFGNAVLEAMSEGCPVIVTPEVGLAPVIENAGAGLVCPGTPTALASAIQSILNDAPRRRAMSDAGRRVVRDGFSWDSVATRMEACYQEIISSRKSVAT